MTICTDMHAHAAYMMLRVIWNSVKHNVSWHTLNTSYKQFFNDRQRDIAFSFLSWSTVMFTKSMDVAFDVRFPQQFISKYEQDAIAKFNQVDWSEDEIRQTIGNLIIIHLAELASVSGQLSKPEKHAFIDGIKKNGIEHAAVKLVDILHDLEVPVHVINTCITCSKAIIIAFIIAGYDTSIWTDAEIEQLKGHPLNAIEYEMLNSAMTALNDISAKYDEQEAALRDELCQRMQALRNDELNEKDNVCSQIDKVLSKNLSGSSAKAMIIDIRSRAF